MSRIEKTVSQEQYKKQISQERTGFDVIANIWNSARSKEASATAASALPSQRASVQAIRHTAGESKAKKTV